MKKTLALLITLSISLLLLASCGGGAEPTVGYYEADGVGYFFAEGGAIVVKDGKATAKAATATDDGFTVDELPSLPPRLRRQASPLPRRLWSITPMQTRARLSTSAV